VINAFKHHECNHVYFKTDYKLEKNKWHNVQQQWQCVQQHLRRQWLAASLWDEQLQFSHNRITTENHSKIQTETQQQDENNCI